MSTAQLINHSTTEQDQGNSKLLEQYSSGPIHFPGSDSGLYERHLLFANVIDQSSAAARDRFEAFARCLALPAGAVTAESGDWVSGPPADFLEAAKPELGGPPFIEKDLGMIRPDVTALRDRCQLPGCPKQPSAGYMSYQGVPTFQRGQAYHSR